MEQPCSVAVRPVLSLYAGTAGLTEVHTCLCGGRVHAVRIHTLDKKDKGALVPSTLWGSGLRAAIYQWEAGTSASGDYSTLVINMKRMRQLQLGLSLWVASPLVQLGGRLQG